MRVRAALLGLGMMLLMLGLLRLIQSEWSGIAEGGTSWIPYAIVLIVAVVLIVHHLDADQQDVSQQGEQVTPDGERPRR